MRKVIGVASGAAVTSFVAAIGWHGLLLATVALGLVVFGLCWVLNDSARAKRLAMLIREWRSRGDDIQPRSVVRPNAKPPHASQRDPLSSPEDPPRGRQKS